MNDEEGSEACCGELCCARAQRAPAQSSYARGSRNRARTNLLLLAFCVLCWLPGATPASEAAMAMRDASSASQREYKIKAAYLLNFTRYITWQEAAFANAKDPLVLCVLGIDPFGPVLDRTVAGRTSHSRPVQVRRLANPTAQERCHLVFIGRDEQARQKQLLAVWRNKPAVTVGETPTFLADGGMINLILVEDTVRFEIRGAPERPGFKISSRLLDLAHRVHKVVGKEGVK